MSTSKQPITTTTTTTPNTLTDSADDINSPPLFIVQKTGLAGLWASAKKSIGIKDPEEEAFLNNASYHPHSSSTGIKKNLQGGNGSDDERVRIMDSNSSIDGDVVEENDTVPLIRRRRKKAMIFCTVCAGIALIIFAIVFPIMVLILIPRWITEAFSTPSSTSTTSIEYLSPLRLLDPTLHADLLLSRFAPITPKTHGSSSTGANSSAYVNGVVGGFELATRTYQTGYNIPMGLPLTAMGRTVWSLSIPKGFVEKASVDTSVSQKTVADGDWRSFADFVIPEDVPIKGGKLTIESNLVTFRVPAYTGAPLPQRLQGRSWPLGISLIEGVLRCFATGDPNAAPKVRLSSDKVNFILGATSLPIRNVDLFYNYDVGKLLVDAGMNLLFCLPLNRVVYPTPLSR
ncbi:hypothetical protein BC829DRAFT_92265 [Chytridium lagenaria]|nr:hypothetical protein BC829DRAFT_92265 [Chytridium lagenaria]